MKCFSLDESGDVTIKNNNIVMVEDDNLIVQKIQKVLSTNKNEWFGNKEEGINFQNILKKGVTEDEVKSEILDGLMQIFPDFVITEFSMELNNEIRKLVVKFKGANASGDTIETTAQF